MIRSLVIRQLRIQQWTRYIPPSPICSLKDIGRRPDGEHENAGLEEVFSLLWALELPLPSGWYLVEYLKGPRRCWYASTMCYMIGQNAKRWCRGIVAVAWLLGQVVSRAWQFERGACENPSQNWTRLRVFLHRNKGVRYM